MDISVCVSSTRPTTVGATVRSILAQTHADWELVVVAQGDGADAVVQAVRKEAGRRRQVRLVAQDGQGVSRARNASLRAAECDIAAMIDDDCEADPNWLAVLSETFAARPDVGIVGGALLAPPPEARSPRNCPTCHPLDVVYDPAAGPRPEGFVWLTASLGLRREAWSTVGDFDECLGAGSHFPVGEDPDFLLRAEALGVRMITTPKAVVHHTYGWRYGVAEVWRHQRNYARGNGALAAKLTLLGDPRGRQSWDDMVRRTCTEWLHRKPVTLPAGVRRMHHFARAYRECLHGFRVDQRGLLRPVSTVR